MDIQDQEEMCADFVPQEWRKNFCINCFKTKEDHVSGISENIKQGQEPNNCDNRTLVENKGECKNNIDNRKEKQTEPVKTKSKEKKEEESKSPKIKEEKERQIKSKGSIDNIKTKSKFTNQAAGAALNKINQENTITENRTEQKCSGQPTSIAKDKTKSKQISRVPEATDKLCDVETGLVADDNMSGIKGRSGAAGISRIQMLQEKLAEEKAGKREQPKLHKVNSRSVSSPLPGDKVAAVSSSAEAIGSKGLKSISTERLRKSPSPGPSKTLYPAEKGKSPVTVVGRPSLLSGVRSKFEQASDRGSPTKDVKRSGLKSKSPSPMPSSQKEARESAKNDVDKDDPMTSSVESIGKSSLTPVPEGKVLDNSNSINDNDSKLREKSPREMKPSRKSPAREQSPVSKAFNSVKEKASPLREMSPNKKPALKAETGLANGLTKQKINQLNESVTKLQEEVKSWEKRYRDIESEKSCLTKKIRQSDSKELELQRNVDSLQKRLTSMQEKYHALEKENMTLCRKVKEMGAERTKALELEQKVNELTKKFSESETVVTEIKKENVILKEEVVELQAEMDEMQDQFREEEEQEYRDLQKELEHTAKNYRILQFKLRKAERRVDQVESEKQQCEDRIRQLHKRFESDDDKSHIRELEQELQMAKEVSVRLHDELELVEEKRAKYEDENERLEDEVVEHKNRLLILENEIERGQEQKDDDGTTVITTTPDQSTPSTLQVPSERKPKLGSIRQSSQEYDISQLMRDLYDSMEREQDIKEQLKFAEEEAKIVRRKLADVENENESLMAQLRKMTGKTSGRFKRPTSKDRELRHREEPEMSEAELKVQLELAEQEMQVLRKKINEFSTENDNLLDEVKFLQEKLRKSGQDKDGHRSAADLEHYNITMKVMAEEIEELKWKLIEKDRELEEARILHKKLSGSSGKRPMLTKSHSFDTDYQTGITVKQQLELVHEQTIVLKEKITALEKQNESIVKENEELKFKSSYQNVPSSDSTQNITELGEKLQNIAKENVSLKERLQSMNKLSEQVCNLSEKLKLAEEEEHLLRKKMVERDQENENMKIILNDKRLKVGSRSADIPVTREQMRVKIEELEEEIADLLIIVKAREADNISLEKGKAAINEENGQLKSTIKAMERHSIDEIESLRQKNDILTNLLEIVTQRADETEEQLDRLLAKISATMSSETEGSTRSIISVVSDGTVGSDDVFGHSPDSPVLTKDWEKQLKMRIKSLEKVLAEERQRHQSTQKGLQASLQVTGSAGALETDTDGEKQLLRGELKEYQNQLREANEQVNDLKERLSKVEESYEMLKEDFDNISKQLIQEKGDLNEKDKVEISAWRTEKERLQKAINDYEEKTDELSRNLKEKEKELSKEKGEADNRSKEDMLQQIQQLHDTCAKYKLSNEELQYKLQKINDIWSSREIEWHEEKTSMTSEFNKLKNQIKQNDQKLQEKDDVIKIRDQVSKEKEDAIAEMKEKLTDKDAEINEKKEALAHNEKLLMNLDGEVKKVEKILRGKDEDIYEKGETCRLLRADIKRRDGTIQQKSEEMKELNKKLQTFEDKIISYVSKVGSLEQSIKKREMELDEKERDVKRLKERIQKLEIKCSQLENRNKDVENAKEMDRKKYQGELDKMNLSNKTLTEEMQKQKQKLQQQQKSNEIEKKMLLLEIQQVKEQLQAAEQSKELQKHEAVAILTADKQKLLQLKGNLESEIQRLKTQLDNANECFKYEKDELQDILLEKATMIQDNQEIQRQMQTEISSLKTKLEEQNRDLQQARSTLLDRSEDEWRSIQAAQMKKLREERLYLRKQFLQEVEKHEDTKLELSMLKTHFDNEQESWMTEKEQMTGQVYEAKDNRAQLFSLQKILENVKVKLKAAENAKEDLLDKHACEKITWEMERNEMQSNINKLEEQKPMSRFPSKLKDKQHKLGANWEKERMALRKTVSETNKYAVELEAKLEKREVERKEQIDSILQKEQETRNREFSVYETTIRETHHKLSTMLGVKMELAELKTRFKREEMGWELDKKNLQLNLEQARQQQKDYQEKLEELFNKMKLLKDIGPPSSPIVCENLQTITEELRNFTEKQTHVSQSVQLDLNSLIFRDTDKSRVVDKSPTRSRILAKFTYGSQSAALKAEPSINSPELSRSQRSSMSPVRKLTNLPGPPPSMLISSPNWRSTSPQPPLSSTLSVRGSRFKKSYSIDTPTEESLWMPFHDTKSAVLEQTMNTDYMTMPTIEITAPLSGANGRPTTLPANIKIGDSSPKSHPKVDNSTPAEITKAGKTPKSARMKFFEGFLSLQFDKKSDSKRKYKRSSSVEDQTYESDSEASTTNTGQKTSTEKRKLFKKAQSLDTSPVGEGVKNIGVNLIKPGAPSSYDPPKVETPTPTKEPKRSFFKKRSSSVDTKLPPPDTPSSTCSSSIGRDISDCSISSRLSKISGVSIVSGTTSASSLRRQSSEEFLRATARSLSGGKGAGKLSWLQKFGRKK